jgi:uncharacterized protein YxeA
MKKTLLLLISIIFITITSCDIVYDGESVTGDGNVVEKNRDVSGFNGIHVSNGIDVYFTQGDEENLLLVADENLHQYIQTEVRNGILHIESDVNIRDPKELKILLDIIDLDQIKVSSAGDVKSENQLLTDNLEITLSSAGDLKLNVSAKTINCRISSSGDAKLWGETDELHANLSSAGNLYAFDLRAKKVIVDVSSAGDAEVHATEEIEMDASSAGDIHYKGNARVVKSHSSSAGSIKKVN